MTLEQSLQSFRLSLALRCLTTKTLPPPVTSELEEISSSPGPVPSDPELHELLRLLCSEGKMATSTNYKELKVVRHYLKTERKLFNP